MSRPRAVADAVWEFVVGDDPLAAAGVVVAIALTAVVAGTDLAAWWVMPICVLVILWASVRRAAGGGRQRR